MTSATKAGALRPFIGLGAGVNRVNTEFLGTLGGNRTVGVGADDSSTELAAQVIAGLAFAISDRANLDLTYRYLMSNIEFDDLRVVGAVGRRSRSRAVTTTATP